MNDKITKIETMEPKNKIRIEFMAGNFCNYKCWYCSPHANAGDYRWHHDYDELIKNFFHLLDFYVRNGKDNIEVNILGGEPSLWPDVSRFAKDLKEYYNANIVMTTNGSRTLRWWNQNSEFFDKILFSYHHKQADLDHFINVLDLVYSKKVSINALVLMDPTIWGDCVQAIEKMKKQSKYSWFITAVEVHPTVYSDEQKVFLNNKIKRKPPFLRMFKEEYKNVLKGHTKVVFENNKKKRISRNWLSLNDLNHFKGWMCNIGVENVNIQKDGKITGTCNNYVYGEEEFYNLYDKNFTEKFNPSLVPTKCAMKSCFCQPECNITKWKPFS